MSMPPRKPQPHPVSEIVEALLVRATQSKPPRLATPHHSPQVIDLSAASDDDLTIVHESRSGLRPQPQPAPPAQQVDVDDDDDIIVVSEDIVALPSTAAASAHHLENIVYPSVADRDPQPPQVEVINIDEDTDDDADLEAMGAMLVADLPAAHASQEVQAVDDLCFSDPVVEQCPTLGDPGDEVVECVAPARRPRLVSSCDACQMRIGNQQGGGGTVRISRCKHVLCARCAVKAVWDSRGGVKSLPVCVVSRCRAPLADGEIEDALSGAIVDEMVASGLEKFHEWRREGIMENAVVDFPGFSAEFTATTGKGDGLGGIERLLEDDLRTACEPLWMWNDEAGEEKGLWMCAACGELEQRRDRDSCRVGDTNAAVAEDAHAEDIVDEVEEVGFAGIVGMPPSPKYPHCAYARALGLYENIGGLGKVWKDEKEADKNKENQRNSGKGASAQSADEEASGRPVRRSSRKRYLSASTVRSQKRRKTSRKTGFAKGTGYAGTSGSEWKGTSEKLLEESQTLDEEATFWLIRIRCFLLREGSGQLSSWPIFMRPLLRHCRLPAHLAKILINESIMDVLGRIPVFYAALRVVHAVTELPSLRILVTETSDGDNGRSIAELVESLSRQAAVLSTGAGPEGLPESTAFLVKQIRKCIRGINRHNLLQVARNRNTVSCPVDVDEEDGKGKSQEDASVGNSPPVPSKDGEGEDSGAGSSISFEPDKVAYIENMRAHQFEAISGLAQSSVFYREALKADKQAVAQGKRQRRIASEVASLCSSLPLSWSSTILLRVDEDRYDFLRACIFGPEGTPYDSGAFIFDIYLPPGYPYVPPKFQLLTTGSGRVRFNPNLYSNGKVCLSLLGTWSGPSWTSASTILQVLVSIQSLILVPDPYFNEPGFERAIGTELGKRSSLQYNQRVQVDCAHYAIRANIRSPMPDLRAGILAHFRLKRRYLTRKLRGWFGTTDNSGKGVGNVEGGGNGVGSANGGAVVSADPMGQGIAGTGMLLGTGPGAATMSGYGPGRNFRAPQLSAMTLELIETELNEIAN